MTPHVRNCPPRGFTRRLLMFGLILIIVTSTLTIFSKNGFPKSNPGFSLPSTPKIKKYQANFTWNAHPICEGGENEKIIKNGKNSIIIIVHSARQNFLRRMVIRETWGVRKDYGDWSILGVIFMVGSDGGPHGTHEVAQNLEAERNYFGDIVAQNFVDTYKNLTLKSIMAYEWLATACPMIDIVIKSDDDVVINVAHLVQELPATGLMGSCKYFCTVFANRTTFRDPKSFWYVTKDEYADEIFPPHCAGLAYLTTMAVVRKVLSVLDSFERKLWIDDVFLTGLVPHRFNQLELATKNLTNDQKNENAETKIIIDHFQAPQNWYFWPDSNPRDHKDILRHWLNPNGSDPQLQKLLSKYFSKRIFFLVDHGPNFRKDFLQIWNTLNHRGVTP